MAGGLTLRILPGRYAICRLPPDAALPAWARAPLCSVTWTSDELSIVCREERVPSDVTSARGFRWLQFQGPFDLGSTGILASVATPLAAAGVSVFAVSTYDTDHLLLRADSLAAAAEALEKAGHTVDFAAS